MWCRNKVVISACFVLWSRFNSDSRCTKSSWRLDCFPRDFWSQINCKVLTVIHTSGSIPTVSSLSGEWTVTWGSAFLTTCRSQSPTSLSNGSRRNYVWCELQLDCTKNFDLRSKPGWLQPKNWFLGFLAKKVLQKTEKTLDHYYATVRNFLLYSLFIHLQHNILWSHICGLI